VNFVQCDKCKLSLPQHRLYPMMGKKNGKVYRVFLCEYCKTQVEKQFKQK